jgi:hypothetical protein
LATIADLMQGGTDNDVDRSNFNLEGRQMMSVKMRSELIRPAPSELAVSLRLEDSAISSPPITR